VNRASEVSNGYPLDADAPFFTTLYTKKRLVPLDFQRIVRKAKAVLGVRLRSPHALRHTFAVELLTATGDLKAVQQRTRPRCFTVVRACPVLHGVRRALGLGYVDALRVYRGYGEG
jgi:integrase